MNVSQKCQHTLQTVFELARRQGHGQACITEVADTRAAPAKFLGLKCGGFVESCLRVHDGYLLWRRAASMKVGYELRHLLDEAAPSAELYAGSCCM